MRSGCESTRPLSCRPVTFPPQPVAGRERPSSSLCCPPPWCPSPGPRRRMLGVGAEGVGGLLRARGDRRCWVVLGVWGRSPVWRTAAWGCGFRPFGLAGPDWAGWLLRWGARRGFDGRPSVLRRAGVSAPRPYARQRRPIATAAPSWAVTTTGDGPEGPSRSVVVGAAGPPVRTHRQSPPPTLEVEAGSTATTAMPLRAAMATRRSRNARSGSRRSASGSSCAARAPRGSSPSGSRAARRR